MRQTEYRQLGRVSQVEPPVGFYKKDQKPQPHPSVPRSMGTVLSLYRAQKRRRDVHLVSLIVQKKTKTSTVLCRSGAVLRL
jgi:hypothetical protein